MITDSEKRFDKVLIIQIWLGRWDQRLAGASVDSDQRFGYNQKSICAINAEYDNFLQVKKSNPVPRSEIQKTQNKKNKPHKKFTNTFIKPNKMKKRF